MKILVDIKATKINSRQIYTQTARKLATMLL